MTTPTLSIDKEDLLTLQVSKDKQAFFMEILENFDFVHLLDNDIWKKNYGN